MSHTYAIGDIHGRLDLLDAALARLSTMRPGRVVFLGDYIDRGPDSRGVVERLMAGPSPGWEWICLQGNHERSMVEAMSTRRQHLVQEWLQLNGGGQTLLSYGHTAAGRLDLSIVPQAHLDWAASLPLYFHDSHRLYVHAGVDPDLPLAEQDPSVLQHKVHDEIDSGGYRGLHVVHGHRVGAAVLYTHRTNLDTKAWRSGQLLVGAFDDAPGGPADVIEITPTAR